MLDRRACRHVLPIARQKGLAYVAASVLKTVGVGKDDSDKRLKELQQATGLSLVELAVRYVMGNTQISTILIGAATPTQIEQSVAAAQQGPLPADLQQAVDALVEN